MGACTPDQIQEEYKWCEGPSGNSTSCSQVRDDPANKVCQDCLFSRDTDAAYGPIIWSGTAWRTNTPGCIALVDRDLGAQSCGARAQAASACADAACDGCEDFDEFLDCRRQSNATVCRAFYLDAICLLRPDYNACTEFATNEEYFRAAGSLFCTTGDVGFSSLPEGKTR